MNDCECKNAGYCKRHGMIKTPREFDICRGENCTESTRVRYWNAWESCKIPVQDCHNGGSIPPRAPKAVRTKTRRGIGDAVSAVTKAMGIPECGGCKKRKARMNQALSWGNWGPIEPVDLSDPRKHLTFHIWPHHCGGWRHGVGLLLERIEQFNGKRVVGIAVDDDTDSPETVMAALDGHRIDRFEIVDNNPKLREVVTWLPMLEALDIEAMGPGDVVFSSHAKGPRPETTGPIIRDWLRLMFEANLDDWQIPRAYLEHFGAVGAFRRFGQFRTRGNWRWHYSGTCFWWRPDVIAARNWRHVDKRFFGTESWIGHHLSPEESACLFMDRCGDLYRPEYWAQTVMPEWQRFCLRRDTQQRAAISGNPAQ